MKTRTRPSGNARVRPKKPKRLSVAKVKRWAMAHLHSKGRWPTADSGAISEAPDWTWASVDYGFKVGTHGLRKYVTLPLFLDRELKAVRRSTKRPPLTHSMILHWAREYRERNGRWPAVQSGEIPGTYGESWLGIDHALRRGARGLRRKSSLAVLLGKVPGSRFRLLREPLSITQIVAWAEDHVTRTGRWPSINSGPVLARPDEKWVNINMALRTGLRGLPGGMTLSRLLRREPGSDRNLNRPKLTYRRILEWADEYFWRHDRWPRFDSGRIPGSDGDAWSHIDASLKQGLRGLPGGLTLVKFLHRHRCAPYQERGESPLTERQILAWADAHFRRTGRWPTGGTGPVLDASGEDWRRLRDSLFAGHRGLPGGSSVARLLAQHREVAHQKEGLRPRIRRLTAADRARKLAVIYERRRRRARRKKK